MLLDKHYPNRIHRNYNYLEETLDKPYKIEGVEIGIREQPIKDKIEGIGGNGLATTFKQFAFIKQPKDVFDTGARLPEQKEESQEHIWKEAVFDISRFASRDETIEHLKSKFTIKRR